MNNEINRITSVLKKTDAFCQTDKFILEAIAKRLYKLEIAQNEPLWTNLNYIPDFFVVLKGSIEITSGSLVCSLAVNDYFWKPNFEAFDLKENSFLATTDCVVFCLMNDLPLDMPNQADFVITKESIQTIIELANHQIIIQNQNQQIELQRKRIAELLNCRKRYMSILGHDLRSPVASIITLSEIMLDDFENLTPVELKGMVLDLSGLSKIHLRLLENLIYWTRLQNDQIAFDKEELTIKDFMTKAYENVNQEFLSKKILLNNQIDASVKVFADSNMFIVLLKQLLSNAFKFSPAESTITGYMHQEDNRYALCISDNGIGIKADKLPQLFDLDKHNSTYGTENEMGTGLGLILCKDIADKHHWQITFESTPGEGTTVCVNFSQPQPFPEVS
jgi:signal transduction histidine kinase